MVVTVWLTPHEKSGPKAAWIDGCDGWVSSWDVSQKHPSQRPGEASLTQGGVPLAPLLLGLPKVLFGFNGLLPEEVLKLLLGRQDGVCPLLHRYRVTKDRCQA